jgi:phosphatidylglycerol lysyltransferase
MSRQLARRSLAILSLLVGVIDALLAVKRQPVFGLGHVRIGHGATINGSRYILLVSGLVLAASSRQLWRGKQRGWQLAIITLVFSLVAHPVRNNDLLGVAPSLLLAVGLVLFADRFPARSDPVRASAGVVWLVLGELGVFVYGTAGLFLLDSDFRESNSLGRSMGESLRLLFVLPSDTLDTIHRNGDWFITSVRVMAVVVLAIAMWHFVQPVIARNTTDRAEYASARQILEEHGTTGLAYFHLLGDKQLFLARDERSLLSYRVVGGVAVVLGEPIGATDSCIVLAHEFHEFCDLHGWRYAYHQVSPRGVRILEAIGLKSLKIGEEAIIDVANFTLDGSHFKRLRTKNRQLVAEGVAIEELARPIDDATLAELDVVSDLWLEDGGHRERTFTLGSFDAAYLQDTTVLVARRADGRIEAFVNILPAFAGTLGNFDLMRRRPDAPNGVMDLLFVHLIERFRAQGLADMTLGFAPLANIEGDGLIARALRTVYESESSAFNFRGLYEFKSKWRPRFEPRALVYRSDLELLTVAYAIARVGEIAHSAPRLLRVGLHERRIAPGRGRDPRSAGDDR